MTLLGNTHSLFILFRRDWRRRSALPDKGIVCDLLPFVLGILQAAPARSISSHRIARRLLRLAPVRRSSIMKSRKSLFDSSARALMNRGISSCVRNRSRDSSGNFFTPLHGFKPCQPHSVALLNTVDSSANTRLAAYTPLFSARSV